MPALFLGHGNPMIAISQNDFTKKLADIGRSIPRPKAILAISAHWYAPQSAITANPAPVTIHDFGGFPPELYQVEYRAPGNTDLALRVQELLGPLNFRLDRERGLDHGVWSVLIHLYPNADVPVVQLSINSAQPAAFHYKVGQMLAPLREEGIAIIGSGNIVHNLYTYDWKGTVAKGYDWARRFEKEIKKLLLAGDDAAIVAYEQLGDDARMAAPTPDHFLPLLYILALQRKGETIRFPIEGFDGGSISMLAVQIG